MTDRQERIKAILVSLLANEFRRYRRANALTQEQLAQRLRISARSYIDLEHGLFLPSAVTLVLFLLQLNDQQLLYIFLQLRRLYGSSNHFIDILEVDADLTQLQAVPEGVNF